jgi:hypothetical protein
MRLPTRQAAYPGSHCGWKFSLPWFGLTIFVLAAAGCEDEVRVVSKRPETRALDQTGIAVGVDQNPRGQAPANAPAKQSGAIVGQKTQEIRNAATELEKGGAKLATTKITAKDYITLQGNAYVTAVGQLSVLSIQKAMDLYHAENDRYPKDYDEFMTVIIKANNISLPQLPPYQKYAYDEKEHKLVVLEYKAIKDQPAPR